MSLGTATELILKYKKEITSMSKRIDAKEIKTTIATPGRVLAGTLVRQTAE